MNEADRRIHAHYNYGFDAYFEDEPSLIKNTIQLKGWYAAREYQRSIDKRKSRSSDTGIDNIKEFLRYG